MVNPTQDFLDPSLVLQAYIREHPDEEGAKAVTDAEIDLAAFATTAAAIFPILKQINDVQLRFEAGRPGDISIYLLGMNQVKTILQSAPMEFADAAELGIAKIAALHEKHKRYQGDLLASAALLDPNVRQGVGNYISFAERSSAELKIARDISAVLEEEPVEELEPIPEPGTWASATQTRTPAHTTPATPVRTMNPLAEYEDWVKHPWKTFSKDQFAEIGLIKYWMLSDEAWHYLSRVALKVQMTPASTAPVESFFSTVGWFDSLRRSRMLPAHLEMVALLKTNWDIGAEEVRKEVLRRFP
jgi:hypothetical protein